MPLSRRYHSQWAVKEAAFRSRIAAFTAQTGARRVEQEREPRLARRFAEFVNGPKGREVMETLRIQAPRRTGAVAHSLHAGTAPSLPESLARRHSPGRRR